MADIRQRVSPFSSQSPRSRATDISSPDFGDGVDHAAHACTPRELYCALQDAEQNVHYFEPAFRFVVGAMSHPELTRALPVTAGAGEYADSLVASARMDLSASEPTGYARSWPTRVAREFAPVGLTDGIWLQGLTSIALVEDQVGMAALKQLMIRCGDPGTTDAYSQRYAGLLRSVGVAPGSIARWELEEMSPCTDVSYERALLGMALALFPSALRPETAGFNLWMSAIGPCPLLEQLGDALRSNGACLSYFDGHDRDAMAGFARDMVVHLLESSAGERDGMRRRIARGFFAAHRSYRRWQLAVRGASVPMTPRDCVVDMVGRKARFAKGHHDRVRVGGCPLERFFGGTKADHRELVAQLAKSRWVRPGAPGDSPLVSSVISIDGPMFEIFTESEQGDLRDWITHAGTAGDVLSDAAGVAAEGTYTAPQDPASLRRYALRRFTNASEKDLMYWLVNADRCPPVRIFAKSFAEDALTAVRSALKRDARLNSQTHPAYSERVAAEMLVDFHDRNVESQTRVPPDTSKPVIGSLLDGCWLQGFANVLRIGFEEYGWLFRIYASELGDGNLQWNHNYVARQMHRDRMPVVLLPATERRLYDALPVLAAQLVNVSMALNTGHFLPELLGLNLSIEARGVCGSYVTTWKNNLKKGEKWAALYYRLHNSIDNYASGHTKWSLAAIQSFMARVKDAAPEAVDQQWRRIWEFWRFAEIQQYGTAAELAALREDLGGIAAGSFAPAV